MGYTGPEGQFCAKAGQLNPGLRRFSLESRVRLPRFEFRDYGLGSRNL